MTAPREGSVPLITPEHRSLWTSDLFLNVPKCPFWTHGNPEILLASELEQMFSAPTQIEMGDHSGGRLQSFLFPPGWCLKISKSWQLCLPELARETSTAWRVPRDTGWTCSRNFPRHLFAALIIGPGAACYRSTAELARTLDRAPLKVQLEKCHLPHWSPFVSLGPGAHMRADSCSPSILLAMLQITSSDPLKTLAKITKDKEL